HMQENGSWQEMIRTGDWQSDQRALDSLRARAEWQGRELRVQQLQQGGYHCLAVPRTAALAASCCRTCGRRAPPTTARFARNIGALVIRFPKVVHGDLCKRCVSKYYWEYTLVTAVLGWWGVISFWVTLYILPANTVQYLRTIGLKDE